MTIPVAREIQNDYGKQVNKITITGKKIKTS